MHEPMSPTRDLQLYSNLEKDDDAFARSREFVVRAVSMICFVLEGRYCQRKDEPSVEAYPKHKDGTASIRCGPSQVSFPAEISILPSPAVRT